MRLPKLDHVKYVQKGRYAYFNTGAKKDGKAIYVRLPHPSAPNFYAVYGALKAGRTKRANAVQVDTVAKLAADYLDSRQFRDKAEATQVLYRRQMAKVVDRWGKVPVDALEPRHVRMVLDGEHWNAGTRNTVLAILGLLYTWARRQNRTTGNPVKDIERGKCGEHEPWPDDVLDAALECENDSIVRLAVHLLYYTGQRIGDVCALRWGDVRKGEIVVIPQKTKRFGKRLHITVHSALAGELERTPRTGMTILAGIEQRALRKRLQAFTKALGVETVPHGLRKNAVNSLLLQGCTVPEVAAITGQTYQVVEHYAARVNTRKLGQAAMLKFEQRKRT